MSTAHDTETVTVLSTSRRVAAEIRAWKARLQVTQVELAALLDVSQQGVSRRLSGHTPFTLDEVGLIAYRFGVHPAVLLGADMPKPGPDGGPGSVLPRMDSNHQPAG